MPKITMDKLYGKLFYCESCGSRNVITSRACSKCGVVFHDTVVQDQNGHKLGIVRRAPDGTVIGFDKAGIKWNKVGNVLLWLLFLPIMLLLYAIKTKNKLFYALAAVTGIFYIAIGIFGENNTEEHLQDTSPTLVAQTIDAQDTKNISTTQTLPVQSEIIKPLKTPTQIPTLSLETMPGIESWQADQFFKAFLKLTGFSAPEIGQGEEGQIYRAMHADNGKYKMTYHATVNKDGKIAEAFFNIDDKNKSGTLGEIAAMSATGREYQTELRDWVNAFTGLEDAEKVYGDAKYRLTTGSEGVYFLIIQHIQYDDYLNK